MALIFRLRGLLAVVVVVLIFVCCTSARNFFRIPRELMSDDANQKDCYKSSPCGWSIYNPVTKEVLDFMPNTCTCAAGKTCEKTDDDLTVSAYVYRCIHAPVKPEDPSQLQLVSS